MKRSVWNFRWRFAVVINIFGLLVADAFSPHIQSLRYNDQKINRNDHSSSSLFKRRKLQLYSKAKDIVAIKDGTNGIAQDAEEYGRSQLQQYFSFPIDGWQAKAGGEVLQDKNVIVCAPTGAGKTVVGEMALHYAFDNGSNAIYTTPLKALSNQKFGELRKIFGPSNVGLSTGDMSINRNARITVMTTEVYRNMAWRAASRSNGKDNLDLDDMNGDREYYEELALNSVVVLDELHYMGQKIRGGVWEECIITSPLHTQIIGLSATLPNADKIASWMQSVTNRSTTLIEAEGGRPVPLRYLFATREGLYPIFREKDAGPGAPKGLLGLRGDGIPDTKKRKKSTMSKNKGFAPDPIDLFTNPKHIKGLELNPKLLSIAQRRMEKINKSIKRRQLREQFNNGDDFDNGRSMRKISPRQEKMERERLLKNAMRKAVPSLPFLLKSLEQREILPAIFFIFSRRGCDEAAKEVCRHMKNEMMTIADQQWYDGSKSDVGILTWEESEQVSLRIKEFNSENEEIKFDDETIEWMLHGVASHHAGQLPAHKSLVESLFRAQLIKVVFATETLAAGINMPARTTVICSMAKRGDLGISLLETSNLLQMSGRAGRRGMDSDGTCVIVATPFEGPEDAAQILTSEIKPVVSQFSASYSLAVNLIARGGGTLEVAQNLVQKSFAMWSKRNEGNKDGPSSSIVDGLDNDSWKDMLAVISVLKSYGCLVEDSTNDSEGQTYSLTDAGKNIGLLGLDNSLWGLVALGGAWDVEWNSGNIDKFHAEMESFFSDDDDIDSFFGRDDVGSLFGSDDDKENGDSDEGTNSALPKPQVEAAKLISLLRSLEPSEMAGYVSCIIAEDNGRSSGSMAYMFEDMSPTQRDVFQSSMIAIERLEEVQKKFSMEANSRKIRLDLETYEVVVAWAMGCSWNEALEISGYAPGDLIRTLHRALDTLRQFGNLPQNAARSIDQVEQHVSPGIHPDIRYLCRQGAKLINRYPVKDPLPFDDDDDEEEEEEGVDTQDNGLELEDAD